MTVMTQHMAQMSVEEFEELAAHVAKRFDAVRLEFINGRVGIKGMTDGNHSEVIRWLQECFLVTGSGLWLYGGGELGLRIEHKLSLPEPLGIELDTEELKRYAD